MTKQKSTAIMKERGFSMVELMVSIAIGLILVVSVGTIYVSNVKAFGGQSDDTQLQETARAAFDVIGYHIRLAGFADVGPDMNNTLAMVSAGNPLPNGSTYTMAQFYAMEDTSRKFDMLSLIFGSVGNYSTGTNSIHGLAGCEGLFNPATSFATYPWACSSTSGPSSITVSYQAQPAAYSGSGVPTGAARAPVASQDSLPAYNSSTGAGGDCGGNNVSATSASPSGPIAINRFYIDSSTNRLMCLGNGDTAHPKPIAEGVMDMRILYGVIPTTLSATAPNDSAARYVTAANVTDWVNVISVQVCMEFASIATNYTTSLSGNTYTNCSGNSAIYPDNRARLVVRRTFAIQNNIFTIPDNL